MASRFFSKFGKASTTSDDNSTTLANSTTDTAKDTKKRRSASREPSSKSSKSRKSSDDTTSTHRSGFSIPTLSRNSSSRNRAVSSPPVTHTRTGSAGNSTTSFHRKAESASASPPVPGVPEGLKVVQGVGGGVRRNSIISVVFGGGKNKDNSIVPQPPTGPTPSTGDTSALGLEHDDDDSPGIPTIITVGPSLSRESLDSTSSTQLGVTVIPPSPLVYSGSLPSTHSRSEEDLPTTTEADTPLNQNSKLKAAGQEPGAQAQPQEATTPTNATSTSTTASVLVSIFGRRPRTSSISSAISGIIGVGGTPSKDKPGDIDVGNPETRGSNDTDPKTPTTAATIKANYFESQKETPPPLPTPTNGTMAPNRSNTAMPAQEVQRKTSTRSMTNIPPPISVPDHSVASSSKSSGHAKAVTSPEGASYDNDGAVTMTPIVESPTALKQDFPVAPSSSTSSANRRDGSGGFGALLSPKKGGDDDTASIISISSKSPGKDKDGEKKRLFKRSTTRKPTGLASAIAATGMAMANPSISVVHAAQMSAAAAAQNTKADSAGVSSKGHPPGTMPYISKSPTTSGGLQGPQRSATTIGSMGSPRSKGRKASGGSTGRSPTGSSYNVHSAGSKKHSRRPSVSAYSDGGNSWAGGLSVNGGGSEYYSGNESEGARSRISRRRATGGNSGNESDTEDEDSDSGDDSSSDDLLDGLDLEDEDIPVTGFAVASNKRNADFHELFPSVPEGDYLIEDYGCALQREILIQGRLYISENHICFHANIFGWITDLAIPTDEITSLEKKMTAFVIPNAIQITTRQARYTFASFLSRDTTYDVIYNIWRLARPDDVRSVGRSSMEGAGNTSTSLVGGAGLGANGNGAEGSAGAGGAIAAKKTARKATQCSCGREGRHYTETAMEATFPGSPEMIHNLMFASGFIKEFLAVNQKLTDIQTTDWMPVTDGSSLLKRNMSYIKPLNAPMGPKQTKCEIQDEMDHLNFDQYISTISTTRTPDVPSGGVFMVKTRTCIMWAGPVSSKVLVTTQVEWTGRSFIKGIIERSAIDGQKVYHSDLEKAMRAYIQEHHGEFVPEGADIAEIVEEEAAEAAAADADGSKADGVGGEDGLVSQEQREKQREKERNQRAWQWAWDTLEGAYEVAKQSTKTALDLVVDAWDQSSSTTILYFIIVILVLSNLYTLMRMGKKEEVGRRKEMMKAEERERWVQSVVMTLWEELAMGKKEAKDLRERFVEGPPSLESFAAAVGGSASTGMPVHPPLSLPTSAEGGTSASKLPPGMESSIPTGSVPPKPASWREEVAHLSETLAMVEERIASIKQSLASFEKLDSLD